MIRSTRAVLVIAVAIVAALFGTRALALSLGTRQVSLMRAQTVLTSLAAAGQAVVGEAADADHALADHAVMAERSHVLQRRLAAAAAHLGGTWDDPVVAALQAQARLVCARAQTLVAAAGGVTATATATTGADRVALARAAGRLAATTAAASTRLAREVARAHTDEREVTFAADAVAALLLIVILAALARLRRQWDLAATERRVRQEAEERLHALVQNSSDLIAVVAPDSTVLYEAGSVQAVLGVAPEAIHERPLSEWAHPDDVPLLLSLCVTDTSESAEIRFQHGTGETRTYEIRATSLTGKSGWAGVVLNIWDVSERKALELELRLVQKLDAVGQLAAGIAHEINTPIQFIGDTTRFLDDAFGDLIRVVDAHGVLYRAARDAGAAAELTDHVDRVQEDADLEYLRERIPQAFRRTFEGIDRVATLVSGMRGFTHPSSLEATAADLNAAIQSTVTIATNEHKYVAQVTTDLGDLPTVECNLAEINQVLLNVFMNACHAVADAVGDSGAYGAIHISSRAEEDTAVVTISDTGAGIPLDAQERIFDPFFTTKEVGRGTGQGLAISRTIVERHGGTLTFVTRPGEGTAFTLRLPVRSARGRERSEAGLSLTAAR